MDIENKFKTAFIALINVEIRRLYPKFNKNIYMRGLKKEIDDLHAQYNSKNVEDNDQAIILQLILIKEYEKTILKNIHLLEEIGNSRSRSASSRTRKNNVVEIAQSSQPIVIPKNENNPRRKTRRRTKSLSPLSSSSGIHKKRAKKPIKSSLKRANSY